MEPPLPQQSSQPSPFMGHDASVALGSLAAALHALSEYTAPQDLLTAILKQSALLVGADIGYVLKISASNHELSAAYPTVSDVSAYLEQQALTNLSAAVLFSDQPFITSPCYISLQSDGVSQQVTVMCFALSWRQHNDSTLNLLFRNSPPDENSLTILRLFLDQGKIALERATQLDQSLRYLEFSAQLSQGSHILSPNDELENAVATLLESTVIAARAHSALMHLKRGRGHIAFVVGRTADGQIIHQEQAPLVPLLDMEQVEAGSLIQLSAPTPLFADYKTILVLPLSSGQMTTGLLSLCYAQPHQVTKIEQQALSIFANHAVTLIERARFLRAMHQRLFELETLNRLSRALQSARTMESILPVLLDETLIALNTNTGMIRLYDAESASFTRDLARGWMSQIQIPNNSDEGITGWVFRTGQVYVAREFKSDPLTRTSTSLQAPEGWGGICVPLRNGTQSVGVLHVSVPNTREIQPEQVQLITTIAEIAAGAIQRMQADETLKKAYVETALALTNALGARDSYTGEHSAQIAELAVALGREMGLDTLEFEQLRMASLLHDIGKIGIPDSILSKPGALTEQEWTLMRQHPSLGAEIIEPVRRFAHLAPLVRAHHERYDGSGYPDGLQGEQIPLGARILTVVDSYSAMTETRVYRQALSQARALQELELGAGRQFDPLVVSAFFRILSRKSSNNQAVSTSANS